jgi:hypothetical protein
MISNERKKIVAFLRHEAEEHMDASRLHQSKGNFDSARQAEDRATIIRLEALRVEKGEHLK